MSSRIAFFDFDGTITYSDTLFEFIKFCSGSNKFYAGFILNSPWLIAYKLKIISNQVAKEKILSFFFKNMPLDKFQKKANDFSNEIIPALVRPKALEELMRLKQENTRIVIVSASPENWIEGWAHSLQLDLIATKMELENNRLTGKIAGKNCYGEEKVRRIKEAYTLSDFNEIYAYGDTEGDKPMLALATKSFYQPFQ